MSRSDPGTSSGNNARRAGSNSPPRSNCRPALRPGPAPDIAHNFVARFASPADAGGGRHCCCSGSIAAGGALTLPAWVVWVDAFSCLSCARSCARSWDVLHGSRLGIIGRCICFVRSTKGEIHGLAIRRGHRSAKQTRPRRRPIGRNDESCTRSRERFPQEMLAMSGAGRFRRDGTCRLHAVAMNQHPLTWRYGEEMSRTLRAIRH
jgi:hypothetical protein